MRHFNLQKLFLLASGIMFGCLFQANAQVREDEEEKIISYSDYSPKYPEVGQRIRLNILYYHARLYNLDLPIDTVTSIINSNPDIYWEIQNHTDCRATKEFNDAISQKRSEDVKAYLINIGIKDTSKLSAKGYGERMLLNDCPCENNTGKGLDCSEVQHQENRRTELVIIKIDNPEKYKKPIMKKRGKYKDKTKKN